MKEAGRSSGEGAPVADYGSASGVYETLEVHVPDIGEFKDVPVIEVFVKVGDTVKSEDALVSLESDKATMDVPAPAAGVVKELRVKVGDKVSEGSVILIFDSAAAAASSKPASTASGTAPRGGERPGQPPGGILGPVGSPSPACGRGGRGVRG